MEKRTSFTARLVAAVALVGAVVILIVAVFSSLGGGSDSAKTGHHRNQAAKGGHRTHATTYVVKTGDTLTAIAHKTGVPVATIVALNPEVDPQILIAGQTLKLR